MAIIPKAKGQGLVSTEVTRRPTQSIESAGIVGRGMQSFAKGLGDVGQVFARLNEQQEKLQADSDSREAVLDAELEIQQGTSELKQNYKDDHKGYADAVAKLTDSIKDKYIKNMSNLTAATFKARFSTTERRSKLKGLSYEQEQRTNYLYQTDQRIINKRATLQTQAPDPTEAAKAYSEIDAMADMPNKYTHEQARQLASKGKLEIFRGTMSGLESTRNIDTALEILSGEENKGLLEPIDSQEIARWKARFENLSNVNTSVKKSLIKQRATDLEASTYDRTVAVPGEEFDQTAASLIAEGEPNKAQSVMIAKQANIMIQDLKKKPLKEIDKILTAGVENLPELKVKGSMNAADKIRLADRLSGSLKKIKQERESKGADYVIDQFSDVQSLASMALDIDPKNAANIKLYAETTKKHQEKLGIKNVKYLTDELADSYAKQLNAPDVTADTVMKLRNGYGTYADNVAAELVKRELITTEQSYVFFMDNPEAIQSVIDLQNEETMKSIEDKLKTDKGFDKKTEFSDLRNSSEFQNFEKAMVDVTNEADNQQIVSTLNRIMQKDYMRMRAINKKSKSDAKKAVIKKYMDNWSITNNDTPVIIPSVDIRREGWNKDRIEDNLDELKTMTPLLQETLNIPVPKEYVADQGEEGGLKKFRKDLGQNTKWVTAPEMDGVILMMDIGASTTIVVAGENGEAVKVTYQDLDAGFDVNKKVKKGLTAAAQKFKVKGKDFLEPRTKLLGL